MVEVEFLHTMAPTGAPRHELLFKVGTPIMLIRNLRPAEGLCNGTRLLVKRLSKNGRTLAAQIISGSPKYIGNIVLLPRIKFVMDKSDLGFGWSRTQFPVRCAFAMTINKSQGAYTPSDALRRTRTRNPLIRARDTGQTLQKVGVHLLRPCFAHGQMYVALSRVGNPDHILVLLPHDDTQDPINALFITNNVVFDEALTPKPGGGAPAQAAAGGAPGMAAVPEPMAALSSV